MHNRKLSRVGGEAGGWGLDAIRKGVDSMVAKGVGGSVSKKTRSGVFSNVSVEGGGEGWGSDHVFLYPVLQPVDREGVRLREWGTSEGAVVVRVYLENFFNGAMDDCLGEAVIELKDLVGEGLVQGWFKVDTPNLDTGGEGEKKDIMVYAKLQLNVGGGRGTPTAEEKEASIVVAQELNELLAQQKEDEGEGFVGGSLNTVKGLMENAKSVQNVVGAVADYSEKVFNLLNWADPEKTMIVFGCCVALMVVFLLFKTRWVVFAGGLFEFWRGWQEERRRKRRLAGGGRAKKVDEKATDADDSSPLLNLIAATPSNEDVYRHYFWESKRRGEIEKEKVAEKRRRGRLATIWKAKWQGRAGIKEGGEENVFRERFVVLQSHRLSWWGSEKEFDRGEEAGGQVMFVGHSGLCGLGVMDLKVLSEEEMKRCSGVFGRGGIKNEATGEIRQVKVLLQFKREDEKEAFEEEVLKAMIKVD